MPVIYLPQNPQMDLSGIGNALVQGIVAAKQRNRFTNALQGMVQQLPPTTGSAIEGVGPDPSNPLVQALTAAKAGLPPDQALALAQTAQQSKLNEAKLQATQASTELTRGHIANLPLEQALMQARTENAKAEVPLKQKELNLRELQINTENTRQKVLLPLEVQLKKLQAQSLAETNPLQRKELEASIAQKNMAVEQLKQQIDLGRALTDQLGLGTGPGATGGQGAKAGPASFETPTTDQPAEGDTTDNPLSSVLRKTAGGDQGGSASDILSGASPADKLAIGMDLASGKLSQAATHISQSATPTGTIDVQLAPGITEKRQVMRSGATKPIAGSRTDARKAPDKDQQSVAQGATQFAVTSELLDAFNKDGKLGDSRSKREINKWLVGHGFDPISGDKDAVRAFDTIVQHNIIGITQLLQGARQTQALRDQIMHTLPKLTDSPEIKKNKIAATNLVMNLIVKNEVESMSDNGVKVPRNLQEIYKDRGLDKLSIKDQEAQFLRNSGLSELIPSVQEESKKLNAPVDQGADFSVGGKTFSKDLLDQAAKESGSSVDQIKEALQKKYGGKK